MVTSLKAVHEMLRYCETQALQAPSCPMTSLTQVRVKPRADSRHMNPADRTTPAHWTQT